MSILGTKSPTAPVAIRPAAPAYDDLLMAAIGRRVAAMSAKPVALVDVPWRNGMGRKFEHGEGL